MTTETAPTLKQIRIDDIGPVTEFTYNVDQPGVHVLKGCSQSGKTTILRSIELATTGRTDEKPPKRDGSKAGRIEAFGKVLKVGRVVREEGELGIDGLGDLDLSVLHTPKFKDADTRDKYRIATLVRLAGIQADESLFYNLLGGAEQFKDVVDDSADGCSDLLEMASKVKRAIDKQALKVEKDAIQERANCEALAAQAAQADPSIETDSAKLQAALSDAMQAHANAKAQREQGLKAQAAVEDAQRAVDGKAFIDTEAISTDLTNVAAKARSLREQVEEIERKITILDQQQDQLSDDLERADLHNKELQQQKDIIASSAKIEIPTEESVQQAAEAIQTANAAIEKAATARIAKEAAAKLQQHREQCETLEKQAKRLRDQAQSAMGVLGDAIGRLKGCPFRIVTTDDGVARLVVTGRKADEFFDELSDGAKWTVIIPMVCSHPEIVSVISQAAWGEIQPANKSMIHSKFVESQCYLFTGQVDDGPLRCEWYGDTVA